MSNLIKRVRWGNVARFIVVVLALTVLVVNPLLKWLARPPSLPAGSSGMTEGEAAPGLPEEPRRYREDKRTPTQGAEGRRVKKDRLGGRTESRSKRRDGRNGRRPSRHGREPARIGKPDPVGEVPQSSLSRPLQAPDSGSGGDIPMGGQEEFLPD